MYACISCTKEDGFKARRKPTALLNKQNYQFKRKYGITISEQQSLLTQQEGLCAICKEVPKKPCVDHCHTTKKVRGILCVSCNMALGLLKDNLLHVQRMGEYLMRQI